MKLVLPLVIAAAFGLYLFKPWQQEIKYKQSGKVHIKAANGSFQLYRNGAPYYIKGASIVDMSLLHSIKASGGNSIRLYDTYGAGPILDSAHKLGLSVILGLRVRQARMELDYANKAAVARQYEELRKEVLRYKNHPALLMWAVGNETTLFIPSRYANFFAIRRVLKAVDDIAAMIHETDPDHPTTMVLASVSEPVIRIANMVCRNIDLLSFNIFSPLKEYLAKIPYSGWKGPYLVTEFGAKGYWSTGKTDWHSRVEPTSYQKSQYLQNQFSAIRANKRKCLGSYVFIWGTKQEYTPTWFSLFSPWPQIGETELSDECRREWTGNGPALPAPGITSVTIDSLSDVQNIYLKPGEAASVAVHTAKKVSGPMQLRWELQEEVAEYLISSYKTQKMRVLADSVWQLSAVGSDAYENGENRYTFQFKTPEYEGPFRLYLYMATANNKVSTANACFYVHKN